ncbi:MAG: type VI secretion system-associated FHA domain protein TagH [Gammaproteobacteria bacterium]|nr:type VI secretion system-associated FHA domain protein TagH [Gammaproteobacteria bacterium]
MRLKLKLIRSADPALPVGKTWDVGAESLSLGRSGENDIKLDDPERRISRQHASINPAAGEYRLLDLSGNGTFLNGTVIGGGNSVPIGNDDQFDIGPYRFQVEFDTDDISLPGLALDDFDADERRNSPLFDDLKPPRSSSRGRVPSPDLGGRTDFSVGGGAGPGLLGDDVFDDDTPVHDPFDPAATPADPGRGIAEAMNVPVSKGADALADEPAQIPQGYVPTEWNFEAPPAPAPEPVAVAERDSGDVACEVEKPAARAPRRRRRPAAPASETAAPAASSQRAPAGADDLTALLAFLRGAGLAPEDATVSEAPLDQLERAGQVFRCMVDGMLDLLRTRNQTKNALRMSRTMIADAGNNPLKFAPTADDALLQLLGRARPGFLTAEEAVREALDDQRNHEVAFLAGVREAFPALIQYLDPQAFARDRGHAIEAGVLRGGGFARARAWQEYVAWFESEVGRLDDGLPPVWRERLVDAYERVTTTAKYRNDPPSRRGKRR